MSARMKMLYGTAALGVGLGLALPSLAGDGQLGLAASDPSQVAGIVAGMQADEVPAFGGQVVAAVARMPLSPKLRQKQLLDVATELAKATPALPATLAEMVANVPLQMLPEWVGAFKTPLREQTAGMPDAGYEKMAADVLAGLDARDDLSADDKTIRVTFAIVLLARGKSPEEDRKFADTLIAGLSEQYRGQVAAAAPSALEGDYTRLLGPGADFRLVVPTGGLMGAAPVIEQDQFGQVARQPNLLVYDVNRPFPLPRGVEGEPEPTRPSSTGSHPVIPPPYGGQF